MTKNYSTDIVCLALPAWEGEYNKSTVQLMGLMAHTHRVLYVDYPYTIKDVLSSLRGRKSVPVKRIFGRRSRIRAVATPHQSTVHVYTPPPVLPINWLSQGVLYQVLLKFNNRVVINGIRRAMATLGMSQPTVVNALNPFYGLYYSRWLRASKTIYYCYDEIDKATWLNKHGAWAEQRYVAQMDAVITTSETLRQAKSTYGKPCFLVKNGVDFALFNQATRRTAPDNQPKIVGYIGSLNKRIAYDFLEYAVRRSPQLQFQFVGRNADPALAEPLARYDNVQFLDPIPYEEVPARMWQFDVCLIPFVKNEFTHFVYPLKVNEYLAVGKPVVMTNFAPLEEFAGVVRICEDQEAFLRAIHDSLRDDDAAARQKRMHVAEQNSWQQRAQEFRTILQRV